jgi:uncharacterized protein (DUF697 family)
MNRPVLLHIVERLENFLGKLPETIQKPILSELTPLKELFLQQRPPRLALTGAAKRSAPELVRLFFGLTEDKPAPDAPMSIFSWQEVEIGGRGTISILDARGAFDSAARQIQDELNRQPADMVFFLDEAAAKARARKVEIENLIACLDWNGTAQSKAKVIGIAFSSTKTRPAHNYEKEEASHSQELASSLRKALKTEDNVFQIVSFGFEKDLPDKAQELMSILGRELPNAARIEMIRISRDRETQREVAQILVKSTTAICAAIGAQPIPLADLPILTTLQLVMVSGIMYLSGRERSLRAATEFIGAIGANVGVGMLLREGTRAVLKFFPGWGNVVCGMVAGAGTYAIGRAASAFFLEGVSLKEARQTYLASRKRRTLPVRMATKPTETGRTKRK